MHIPETRSPVIWCDNIGAAALAANPVYHARNKHIEIDVHFIRDIVMRKEIEIRYIPTHEQTADALTKGLSVNRFLKLKDKLQVVHESSFHLRGNVSQLDTPAKSVDNKAVCYRESTTNS